MASRQLEGDYMRALLARVPIEFPAVRFFRRNTGMVKVDDRAFKAGIPGQCDLYIIGRKGWHGEVEIKRFGKLSEAQQRWRDWCFQWQVPWLCVEADKSELPSATIDRWCEEIRMWMLARGAP